MNSGTSGRFAWVDITTYTYNCTGTGECMDGPCDECTQCVSTTTTYQYVYLEDTMSAGTSAGNDYNPPIGVSGNSNNTTTNNTTTNNTQTITTPTISYADQILNCINGLGQTDGITIDAEVFNNHNWDQSVLYNINKYLGLNSCSTEAQEIAIYDIETLMNPLNSEMLEHFNITGLTNECAKQVILNEILGETNANFINSVRNLFAPNPNVHLQVENTDNISEEANAATAIPSDADMADGEYNVAMGLSNSYLNGNPTKLSIALTTIHEMAHAKLIYHYLKGELLTEYPNYIDLKDKFDTYIADRTIENYDALEDAQHMVMVDFIGTMSYSLYKYAQVSGMSNVTHQYCKEITKGSFYNTPAMPLINTGDSTAEELNNKYVHEQNNTSEAKGDDC